MQNREGIPFTRSKCACEGCRVGCRTMPGSLIPGDLERISERLMGDRKINSVWLLRHFGASEGALVIAFGGKIRVPTIVPRQKFNGHCVFLDGGSCMIHDASPFNCAYPDTHQGREEGHRLSMYAVAKQAEATLQPHQTDDECRTYRRCWELLKHRGDPVPPLSDRRARFSEEYEEVVNKEKSCTKKSM